MAEIDRILRAKVQLQKKNPFYGHILLSIIHKPDENIPTACINIEGKMRYNPDWIKSLTDEQVEGVMKHESLHLILQHLKRRFSYLKRKNMIAEQVWSIAEDLVVNDILVSGGHDLPEGIIPDKSSMPGDKSTHRYTIDDFGITIEEIDKKSCEYIYDEIIKQLPTVSGKGQQGGTAKMQGGMTGDDSGDSDGDDQEQQEDQQDDDGNGDGENDKDQQDKDGKSKGDKEQTPEQEMLNKLPKNFDQHERGEVPEQKEQEQLKKWQRKFVEAVQIGRDRGDLPAGMERLCQELFREKLNWRGLLWRYITRTIPFDYCWGRPSRKSHSLSMLFGTDMALPSMDREKVEVVVSIDTSGSIDKEELTEFVSEIAGIARSFHSVDIYAIVCDAEVNNAVDMKNATPDDIERLVIKGGGGTSHVPVFKWLDENKANARLIICFTDGATEFPDKNDVSIPTLWVLCGRAQAKKEHIPFGEVIVIPHYED